MAHARFAAPYLTFPGKATDLRLKDLGVSVAALATLLSLNNSVAVGTVQR